MTDDFYYSPTTLFRQNAMRMSPTNSPSSSPNSSTCQLDTIDHENIVFSNPKSRIRKWMLNDNHINDTAVLSKTCSLNRVNIKSNYWKIPDESLYLTSMDVCKSENDPILAISSGSKKSNLFIYQLDPYQNYLVHNTTITLPNIYSMKWLPEQDSLCLATGNDKGYAHIIQVPEPGSKQNGEIIKRMNHAKYLKKHTPGRIDKINNLGDDLLTLYKGNLFRWDTYSRKSSPKMISTIRGVNNFDIITNNLSTIALSGNFGVSLFDLREKEFRVPSSISNDYQSARGANNIKWSPTNEYLFAASHNDGKVRLWDTRMQDFYGCLNPGKNYSKVTNLEWNDDDIFTSGNDGNIIHWNLSNTNDNLLNCSLKEGIDSVKFNGTKNIMESDFTQRQCGTVIPASNTSITGMMSLQGNDGECRILSIDQSAFFGVHSKIYDAANVNLSSEKLYYSSDDIELLIQSQQSSSTTLVESLNSISQDEITSVYEEDIMEIKPLFITKRKSDNNHVDTSKEIGTKAESETEIETETEFENETEAEAEVEVEVEVEVGAGAEAKVESKSKELQFVLQREQKRTPTITSIIPENMSNETLLPELTDSSRRSLISVDDQFSDNDSLSTNPTVFEEEYLHKGDQASEFNFSLDNLVL